MENKEESDELSDALKAAGILNLKEKFIAQKVTVDLIPLMEEEHLESLGVTLLGQRVLLKNYCKNHKRKNEVETETTNVFRGEMSSSGAGTSTSSLVAKASRLITQLRSEPGAVTERHTKKRKRGKSSTWSRDFTKNLVVIDFQESASPQNRTLHDYDKVYEGTVTLNGSMSEDEVRDEIVSLVKCKKSIFHTFDDLGEKDFQFVKCANRRIRVPDGIVNCDGDGVKTLYRSGSIYVRFTRSFSTATKRTPSGADGTLSKEEIAQSIPLAQGVLPSGGDIVIRTTTEHVVTSSSEHIPCPSSSGSLINLAPLPVTVTSIPSLSLQSTCASGPRVHVIVPANQLDSVTPDTICIPVDSPLPPGTCTQPPSILDAQAEYVEILSSDSEDYALEDTAVQMAIHDSFTSRAPQKQSFNSVEAVLRHFSNERCHTAIIPEDRQKLIVRRKHIWADAKRSLKQPGFNDTSGLNITFIGEPALDAGGPTREFFRLALQKMSQDGSLFTGPAQARLLEHNILALQRREYHIVGHLIALSLLYGGGAPHFFSESVVAYLLDDPIGTSIVGEVMDPTVKDALNQLLEATTTKAFQELLDSDEMSFRFDAGVTIPSKSVTISDRDDIVVALGKNFVIYSCKAELDQLKDGLSHLGVLEIIRDNRELMKPLLLSSGKPTITSYQLLALFKVKWSPEGSNRRECEEAVVFAWTNYVHSCEGDGRKIRREDDSDDHVVIQVHHILQFATGADVLPPMGFDLDPEIEFTGEPNQTEMRLPSTSTCGPTLYFPLVLHDPDIFAEKMDISIIGGQCFGIA